MITFLVIMLFGGGLTAIVDPYFHYHKPLETLQYRLEDGRYQNDGIVKHFDYDGLITGSSMTRNFKTTEFDALFQVHSVKVPFLGGTFREVNENLERAIEANQNIRYVIRSVDCSMLENDADELFSEELPTYLYDRNPWNDVKYLFNLSTFMEGTVYDGLLWTLTGKKTTTFDEYMAGGSEVKFGKQHILEDYERPGKDDYEPLQLNCESLEQNMIEVAKKNPQIEFYYFFPPYSILWFDSLVQKGQLEEELDMQKQATEMMLACNNIHLFGFFDAYDITENLDLYSDIAHYSGEVNSWIMENMKENCHRLTNENYEEYYQAIQEHYGQYDYDELFRS